MDQVETHLLIETSLVWKLFISSVQFSSMTEIRDCFFFVISFNSTQKAERKVHLRSKSRWKDKVTHPYKTLISFNPSRCCSIFSDRNRGLISSSDLQLQEYGITTILNLSLCDENKEVIALSGAIKPLTRALKSGTSTARENSACVLLRLSQIVEYKITIGRSGVVPPLVDLLEHDTIRGKKDASTVLYALCSLRENKIRAVHARIMQPLVELMAYLGSNMVDKSAYVASLLISHKEGRDCLVEEGGIPLLVEIVEVGTQRQKELRRRFRSEKIEQQQLGFWVESKEVTKKNKSLISSIDENWTDEMKSFHTKLVSMGRY